MTESTKKCHNCGCSNLILLGTLNLKICPDCLTRIKWDLQEGQLPIYGGTGENNGDYSTTSSTPSIK